MISSPESEIPANHARTALVLSGGGARAAYQVGVLRGITDLMPDPRRSPFGIICGTSAGAINSTALACHADNYRNAVYVIERVWRSFSPERVYRTDLIGVLANALRWLGRVAIPMPKRAVSFLDNSPLRELLEHYLPLHNIDENINAGHLRALSVTASSYSNGNSVAFFQGAQDLRGWRRHQRIGLRSELTVDHLLASAAIPTIFPSIRINREYFGDGAMRQLAPLSPALNLGAEKVLVVGVSGNRSARNVRRIIDGFPSMAQITGHLLNSVFLDSLEYDVEHLENINRLLSLVDEERLKKSGMALRPIDHLVISPSKSLDQIASHYLDALPTSIRFFLRGMGGNRSSGSSVMSYLLFERHFCNDLIELGYHDAMANQSHIRDFFGWKRIQDD